jgi:hypothetical protein
VEPPRQGEPIGDIGPMAMPLDEALDCIAKGPMARSWH